MTATIPGTTHTVAELTLMGPPAAARLYPTLKELRQALKAFNGNVTTKEPLKFLKDSCPL